MIAVKREERQTPASTRVSGENLCILAKARIKKIEPNAKNPKYLHTVTNVGYKLTPFAQE